MRMRIKSILLILLIVSACATQQTPKQFRHRHHSATLPKDKVAFLVLYHVILNTVDGKYFTKNCGHIEFLPGSYNMSFYMGDTVIGNYKYSSKIPVNMNVTLEEGRIYQASRVIKDVKHGTFNWDIEITDITDEEEVQKGFSYKDSEPVLSDVEVLNNRARAYNNINRREEAIADLDKSIKLDPNNSKTYVLRSLVYNDMGKHEKAITESNKAVEINPLSASAFNNRGYAYQRLDIYSQAILDYNRAIKLDATNSLYRSNLGYTYKAIGNYDEAIKHYNQAINIEPKNFTYTNSLGDIYQLLGDMEKACEEWKKAHDIKFGNSTGYLIYCYSGPVYNVSKYYLDRLPVSEKKFTKPKSSNLQVNFKDQSHRLWIDDQKWNVKKREITGATALELYNKLNQPIEITHTRGEISVFLDTKTPPVPLAELRNDMMNNLTTNLKLKDITLAEEFRNINGKKILSLNLTGRSKTVKSGKIKIDVYLSYSNMGTNSLVLTAAEGVYNANKSDVDDLLNGLVTTQTTLAKSEANKSSLDKKTQAKEGIEKKLVKLDSLHKKGLLSKEDYEYNKKKMMKIE
ncbi:MAG TPA: tetratricopeptide repeat protein [Desulfobacteraceae bacterium]|nr:tetratricopeptide repeat protein [Desulfobacteraceae bacterium]HPQ29462.1 tetratricopeptide repeat protein [Desulfobacteraceae bacterium]